jgi:hypothetical protein
VCYNYGTTLLHHLERCALWGRRYNRFPGWFVDPQENPFKNVNRLKFRSGNYGNDNNNGPPDRGNRPPPGDKHGDNGDNGSPPNNDNNNTSTTVPTRVKTHANPV